MSGQNGAGEKVQLRPGEGWFLLEKSGKTFLGPVVEEEEDDEVEGEEPEVPASPDSEEPELEEEPSAGAAGVFTLCPCYVVRYAPTTDPRSGAAGVAVMSEPYFFLGHHTPVTIVDPDVVLDLADVAEADREIFVQCVRMAENSRTQSRMARSGIVAAAPGAARG